MIALELSQTQQRAVEAPYDGCFAILGAAGSGKSTALAQRAARLGGMFPGAEPMRIASPRDLEAYATDLLRTEGANMVPIDDVEAELLFAQACEPLLELQWEEFADARLDCEVPGLRSPRRFLAAAYRLIRRLEDADIAPEFFLSSALTGATEFYANPPNFSDPALLLATKEHFHDSLDPKPEDLTRQHRCEIHLAKILARLYADYLTLVDRSGRMTGRDAVLAATRLLRENVGLAARLREHHRFAFVDEAQELTAAEVGLLRAIFGESLGGVTLCGDPASAVAVVRRAQPAATFALAAARVELSNAHRSPRCSVHRPKTQAEEAAFVAERVADWIGQGVPAERIAVIFRSVQNVEVYENALLDRNVPAVISGDFNLFEDRRAQDALALLWNAYDPFRHDWLLRTLSGPGVGLSDASLWILCSEPPDPQRPLFALDEEPAPTARASRWNPKRDLRLGWNVIRGERDDALSEDAAARVRRFRRLRERWVENMQTQPFEAFARAVWRDGLARAGAAGSARARSQQIVLQRLLERLGGYAAQSPDATTGDVLEYAEMRRASTLRPAQGDGIVLPLEGFVRMMSVEAARGQEFEHVVVADVRPGAFPLWYVPDAFLFSPRFGMIPKETAGDAHAGRTAKFSYYMFAAKAAGQYNERERRALHYAIARARRSALVTASGTPTRGVTAPELLEELRSRCA